ncbi:DUF2628 domain-containing protein [Roseomonas sp. M0104]|uniref:DUF2628 domain-containing protein n=1 Tax=Teichococcus coralli TaxID=2545983 RepID=A0A845B9T0_9PROT|nr:DUF2628 domain-containing protein [Pseudoroseomonas coralli]MXP62940.1 DUF2628 domain-containing protein [Pseudoroseomonas coralli]
MRAWTVHPPPAPPPASVPATGQAPPRGGARQAGLVLVPERFSLLAALLPPLWFLLHRMWLVLVVYLALAILAAVLLPAGTGLYAGLAAHVLAGLQAQDLRRWTLARQGRPAAGVVLARDEEAALLRALNGRPDWARLEAGMEGRVA